MKHLEKHQQLNQFFLPDLCNTRAILILLAVSEALILAMTLLESSLTHFSWERFSFVSVFVFWVCLISVFIICPLRNFLVRFSALPASLLALVVIALVTFSVSLVSNKLWFHKQSIDWPWAVRNVLISLIFGSVGLRYFYMQSQWRIKKQAELRSRLSALQASIRPHFFFNALNTVVSLIPVDPERAETTLLDLSGLFRVVLNTDENLIPLAEEIELGRRYLDIEHVRIGEDKLSVSWQLPDEIPDLLVPQLFLQPLLENAIYHGIQPSIESGYINIYLIEEGDFWVLIIRNSKPQTQKQMAIGHGIAQENTRARLSMLKGKTHVFFKESEQEYIAIIKLSRGAAV